MGTQSSWSTHVQVWPGSLMLLASLGGLARPREFGRHSRKREDKNKGGEG